MNTKTTDAPSSEIVPVDLGARSYDIHIGSGLLPQAGAFLKPLLRRARTAILTDEHVAKYHLATLQAALDAEGIAHSTHILAAGEQTKSFTELEALCRFLLAEKIERGDMIIALGGGVVGDLTGFAAAIVRRGLDYVQIPTTLLAQVDSSVGGKTAINTPEGKNLVGAFHQPRLVIADVNVLATLPPRDLRSGYAEVVKYGLIDQPDFFEWLESNGSKVLSGDKAAQIHAVATSCKAKARIVAADEREQGMRALLNLGHTFGHALEAETGYSERLQHGEGVGIGMVLAHRFCTKEGMCAGQDSGRVEAHLKAMGLMSDISDIAGDELDAAALVSHMYQDKKVSDGRLNLILTKGIGQAFVAKDVSPERLKDFLSQQV